MAETIVKGYLVNRIDFDVFDEIITFISDTGNIFTVVAKGVKKILSKNAKSLFFGSLCEFEFFASRKIDGVGKLKKINLIENNNIELNKRRSLLLLNSLVYHGKLSGINFFEFFKETIKLIEKENDDDLLILYILLSAIKFLGLPIYLNHCSLCKSRLIKDFSIFDLGFTCKKHSSNGLKVESKTIEIIYLTYLKKFNVAKKFSSFDKMVASKIINGFINDHSGISFLKNLLYN